MLVQIYLGALVAGLRAGLIYNTWPLIDGALVPEASRLFFEQPWWRNFFENTLMVQFNHRMMAYAIFVLAILHAVDVVRTVRRGEAVTWALALASAVTLQAGIGIVTLLHVTPLPLALGASGDGGDGAGDRRDARRPARPCRDGTGSGPAGRMTIVSDASVTTEDPYLWLEEVDGPQARAWVEARNAETTAALCDARFEQDRAVLLDILNAPDRIPWIAQRGAPCLQFLAGRGSIPRGSGGARRSRTTAATSPEWEILLDVDALAKAEGENWVWRGCVSLPPEHRRGLVQLSRGGADAVVTREFDLSTRRFVDDGFVIPETKGGATWIDADTLLVSATLGGERIRDHLRLSAHRAALAARHTVRGRAGGLRMRAHRHAGVGLARAQPQNAAHVLHQAHRFRPQPCSLSKATAARSGCSISRSTPTSTLSDDWLILNLRSDWALGARTYPAGALLVIDIDTFLAGGRDFAVLFEPTPTCFLQDFQAAGDVVAFKVLDNVRSRVLLARFSDGAWQTEPVVRVSRHGDGRLLSPVRG